MTQSAINPIFISYSRRDNDIMRRLVKHLRNQGVMAWVDNEKLIPGTPIWEEEIERAIKAASAVVALMSPDSKNSEWVRREISLADQNHKRIFPVLVSGDEDTSITLRLITRQFVDLRHDEITGLTTLYEALSQYLEEAKSVLVVEESATDELSVHPSAQVAHADLKTAPLLGPGQSISPWIVLGWVIAGAIGGFVYSEYDEIAGGVISGGIAGLITSLDLRAGNILSNQKNMMLVILTWAMSGVIGWAIGWLWLTEAIGAGIGMAFFAIIGLISMLGINYIRFNWKSTAVIVLAWAIGGALGWSISKGMIDGLGIEYATSWAIGTAIGWGIGGYVMSNQLKNQNR